MLTIDKLCYTSNLRYVNATEKFFFAVLTLLVCVASRSAAVAVVVLLSTGILTVYKGGIPFSYYMHLMKLPLVFLLLSVIAMVINLSHTPLDAFAIPMGNIYLTGSYASVKAAGQLVLTALASVSCLYFLSLSTPMTDILQTLKSLHVPDILIELMLLIYRFIFLLLEISSMLNIARQSRLGNRDIKVACRSTGQIMSVLLVRAMERSSALYDAMESRLYDGTIRVLSEHYPPVRKEITYITLYEICLLAVTILIKM